jgi:disulfide bond formation protein DsbB
VEAGRKSLCTVFENGRGKRTCSFPLPAEFLELSIFLSTPNVLCLLTRHPKIPVIAYTKLALTKNGNIIYLPAKTLGSYVSVFMAMLCTDMRLENQEAQKCAENLAKVHAKIKLTKEEILKITNWIDTNCQYYGT